MSFASEFANLVNNTGLIVSVHETHKGNVCVEHLAIPLDINVAT
jgi:hypothetical protein